MWKNNRFEAEEKTKEAGLLHELIEDFEKASNESDLRKLEIKALLNGRYDSSGAVISVQSGAGGNDASDWAGMLLKMYHKYAEIKNWKVRQIASDTLEIKEAYAYGFLKNESGVHRLVRISPYDSKGLRHTSFALVEILPDLPRMDMDGFKIPESELKLEFSRSSGPGGQNVNKVETAVRVVHIPTGLAAASESERSQAQNKEKAISLLKAKLIKLMEEHQAKELGDLRTKVKPKWGSQIRSYVLHPYKMVKDHRTNVETSQVDKVLDGELDEFIDAGIELKST